jgi:hypothetical protein
MKIKLGKFSAELGVIDLEKLCNDLNEDFKDFNEDLGDLEKFFHDLEEDFKDFDEDLEKFFIDLEEDLKDSDDILDDLKDELKKVIEIASFHGIGCRVDEKVGGKLVKNKAKIKVAPKGIIILSPPDNDKRIPWEKIVSGERLTHDSLKINLVKDTKGVDSPIIYLTNSYYVAFLVKIINDSAKGENNEI